MMSDVFLCTKIMCCYQAFVASHISPFCISIVQKTRKKLFQNPMCSPESSTRTNCNFLKIVAGY